MASERQNMSEQEISIKAREHELYVKPLSQTGAKPVKPFEVYLRETPAEPLSTATKADTRDGEYRRGPPFSGRPVAGDHASPIGSPHPECPASGEDGAAAIPARLPRFGIDRAQHWAWPPTRASGRCDRVRVQKWSAERQTVTRSPTVELVRTSARSATTGG